MAAPPVRLEADYLLETASDMRRAVETMAGEQSSGTFVPVPGETPELKARSAADLSGYPALADDSGLCVDALNGDPGVYTADWAETPNGRDWNMAMQKVEDAVVAKGPDATRGAHFVSVLALAWPDGHVEWFEGRAEGTLVWPPRGDVGFGYDPVFVPLGYDQTYAELPHEAKNAISHRNEAFKLLEAAVF